ncbi:carboxylating nicotinate-nucleotide diphosphorylase [Gilvimarinus sp. F26214L]|uniref:carboxylating nicotinate-nucleotide diphosphorylase n=1 Tax=Gilvimarinus sp. DZF01 TaxID=3461371 RepID=UPI0040461E6A
MTDFSKLLPDLEADISRSVRIALEEDIGDGDITARLIPAEQQAEATVLTREDCVVCGTPWVDEVFRQLDPDVSIQWMVKDGDRIAANTTLCTLKGKSRSLLTGERTALNFLQLLSGTATTARQFADLVKDSAIKILDTRKTIPGLRTAQKYAVRCGGCHNHRIGLFDAFLIKENHIAACGGIKQAVEEARRQQPGKTVEVEVENVEELVQALEAQADVIMLDNFSGEMLTQAVRLRSELHSASQYEVSGNLEASALSHLAGMAVDYASSGALTKHLRAIDLSMRIG